MTKWPVHARIDGPIVMIGFGSIGKGTLPLIERHFDYDKKRFVVIDPEDKDRSMLDDRGIRFVHEAVTKDNYRKLLTPLLTAGGGQGFCVNVSVDTSSLDLMELCREIGALYIDTVVEPWPGFYFDAKLGPEARSNYALRETVLAARRKKAGRADRGRPAAAPIRAWCPGSSSRRCSTSPTTSASSSRSRRRARNGAGLPRRPASKASISPSATPSAPSAEAEDVFVNTWSVEGFISEGMQPAELGWGTHEKWMPENGRKHKTGCQAAIYLLQPGANTRVRSWTPTARAQYGFLVTHNEFDLDRRLLHAARGPQALYRPTCHYAYHPCNDAVLVAA